MTIDHKIGEWFNDKIYLDKKIMRMDKNQWGNYLNQSIFQNNMITSREHIRKNSSVIGRVEGGRATVTY
jgi:hypothetical protein